MSARLDAPAVRAEAILERFRTAGYEVEVLLHEDGRVQVTFPDEDRTDRLLLALTPHQHARASAPVLPAPTHETLLTERELAGYIGRTLDLTDLSGWTFSASVGTSIRVPLRHREWTVDDIYTREPGPLNTWGGRQFLAVRPTGWEPGSKLTYVNVLDVIAKGTPISEGT